MLSRVWLFVTPWTVATRLLHPWNFPGKSKGVGCHFLLQGIFLTQGSNPGILNCRQILYCLSHQGITTTTIIALIKKWLTFTSVQFSHSVVSDSLQPSGLQHTRLPCPSPTTWVYSNSCPLHWLCHPTISASVILFSSCLQSLPASGSFQMSQFFPSGGQNIEVSALTSVLPMNIQDSFP